MHALLKVYKREEALENGGKSIWRKCEREESQEFFHEIEVGERYQDVPVSHDRA